MAIAYKFNKTSMKENLIFTNHNLLIFRSGIHSRICCEQIIEPVKLKRQ